MTQLHQTPTILTTHTEPQVLDCCKDSNNIVCYENGTGYAAHCEVCLEAIQPQDIPQHLINDIEDQRISYDAEILQDCSGDVLAMIS